jgi:hypothetical protein
MAGCLQPDDARLGTAQRPWLSAAISPNLADLPVVERNLSALSCV